MRPIRFRAWDKTGGEVMLDVLAVDIYNRRIQFGAGPDDWRNWDDSGDITLLQFTGLRDKKGKDIYEGDIVHCEDEMHVGAGEEAKLFSTNENQVISFEDGAFRFDGITLGDMINPSAHPLVFEVIGNIYENPELLK